MDLTEIFKTNSYNDLKPTEELFPPDTKTIIKNIEEKEPEATEMVYLFSHFVEVQA